MLPELFLGCMSLTSFLKNNGDARILIDQTFEKPTVSVDTDRLADPQTSNYALIGTAFDYVLRFEIERHYDDVDSKPWVARSGLNQAHLLTANSEDEDALYLDNVLENAESHHQDYLESGTMTDDLLAATLDLARLDWVYRSGRISDDFRQATNGDIADLRQLYEIIPEQEFSGLDSVLLNPTFGSASHLVSGADADLILDNTLLDIKTVKDPKLKPKYWRQLVGYAILADLAHDELEVMPELFQLGIYFSRHATVWRTSATRIYDHDKYDQFKMWFQKEAGEHFSTDINNECF